MKVDNKSLIKNLLRENLQQADKLYFKNGKLSEKARQIILMITKGDSFTKLVSDMYYAELIQNHKNGEWISKTMDKNHKETDKPNNDVLDNNTLKELQVFHQDLVNYNKNVFPIKDFNINGVENIHYFMSALKQRRLILKMFGELPSIATRNMKGDIRQERTYPELQDYRSDLEYFMAFYSMLSNRDENAKKKIELKMFKNNITLEELLKFAEEKENLVGGTKFTKNKVKQIVKEDGYDLAILYEKNNIMIVEVSGPDGIKKIGCNSLWCFTYGSGFNNAYGDWNNYSTNDFVYVIIDFNQSPDSPEFMHVLIKPLQDEYGEDEDDNPSTLFDMSNEVQYNPNRIITNYIDFETAKKIMNFGEEIEEPEQTQQKKVSYKDPNQLSLFEIKQKLREALLPEVTTGNSFIMYHGSPHKINSFVDDFVGGKDANDQEGPGIYFTSSLKNAMGYGDNIYKVELSPKKPVSTKDGKDASLKEIEWLIKQAPNWKDNAQNWHENPLVGYKLAAKDFIHYNENSHQQFLQVWIDFYRYQPVKYVRNMVKLGYDSIIINDLNSILASEGKITHIIVLNPSIIKFLGVEN